MKPLIKKALKSNNLTPNDLFPPSPVMKAEYCGAQFSRTWNLTRWKAMQNGIDEVPNVMPTIFKAFIGKGRKWFWAMPIYYISSIISPVCIQFLIRVIQYATVKTAKPFIVSSYFGYILCGVVLIMQMVHALIDTVVTTYCFRMATQGFQALQDVLYLKMMTIKANNTQMKDVTNLLFTDSFKI